MNAFKSTRFSQKIMLYNMIRWLMGTGYQMNGSKGDVAEYKKSVRLPQYYPHEGVSQCPVHR